MRLSAVSKAVHGDYDGKLEEAGFSWCKNGRVSTLFAFVRPRLERSILQENFIFNKGLVSLSKTIEGGYLSNLIEITISTYGEKVKDKEGATLLATAVLSHCPKVDVFSLSGYITVSRQAAVKKILGERKGVIVYLS